MDDINILVELEKDLGAEIKDFHERIEREIYADMYDVEPGDPFEDFRLAIMRGFRKAYEAGEQSAAEKALTPPSAEQ